jgi:hypothetical protein
MYNEDPEAEEGSAHCLHILGCVVLGCNSEGAAEHESSTQSSPGEDRQLQTLCGCP